MKFLFLFLDGVGLGKNNAKINPFCSLKMPNLESLLGGQKLIQNHHRIIKTTRSTFLSLDACLGIEGRPQSASGQATILTGKNIPSLIGEHYGPKPNARIRSILKNDNIFNTLKLSGYQACLLNAFPKEYFKVINSGKRLPGAIAMAARAAEISLMTTTDLVNGEALSADFTAQGWRQYLKYQDMPVLTPSQAGERLSKLAGNYDFTFFEYWLSDYAGHKRDMEAAQDLLKTFDQVLGGLLSSWNDEQGLILITSDHGNLENLAIRNHTRNPVPAIIIGAPELRKKFTHNLKELTDIQPAILRFFP